MADPAPGQSVPTGSVYRRIPNWQDYFKDGRPTSLNFRPDSGEETVSMALTSMVTPDELLAGFPGFGRCTLKIEALLALGLTVTYTPEHGQGHVDVGGLAGKDDCAALPPRRLGEWKHQGSKLDPSTRPHQCVELC